MAQWDAPSAKVLPLIPRSSFAVLTAAEPARLYKFSKMKFGR
jgi:hypothetical protein